MCFPFMHDWDYRIQERIEERDASTLKVSKYIVRECNNMNCFGLTWKFQRWDEKNSKWIKHYNECFTLPYDIKKLLAQDVAMSKIKDTIFVGTNKDFTIHSPIYPHIQIGRFQEDGVKLPYHDYTRWRVWRLINTPHGDEEREVCATFQYDWLARTVKQMLSLN